jgi:hypothetical protein
MLLAGKPGTVATLQPHGTAALVQALLSTYLDSRLQPKHNSVLLGPPGGQHQASYVLLVHPTAEPLKQPNLQGSAGPTTETSTRSDGGLGSAAAAAARLREPPPKPGSGPVHAPARPTPDYYQEIPLPRTWLRVPAGRHHRGR